MLAVYQSVFKDFVEDSQLICFRYKLMNVPYSLALALANRGIAAKLSDLLNFPWIKI